MTRKEAIAKLTADLKAASAAHHDFEEMTGEKDVEWAEWYATFIIDKNLQCAVCGL